MTASQSLLDGIAKVSPVACDGPCGFAEVVYNEEFRRPEISHAYANCRHVLEPDSPAAAELALIVDKELARYVAMADYGEPVVVHVWGAT